MGLLRKEQKKLTRRQIKDAAVKLMIEKGIENTQIHDICRDANVAPGTFYIHFSNKDEIINELVEDFNSVIKNSLISNWPKLLTTNFNSALAAIADTYVQALNGQKDLLRILSGSHQGALPIKLLSEGINPKLRFFISAKLKDISKKSSISSAYIDFVVHSLLSVWIGVGVKYSLSEQRLSEKEIKEILIGSTVGMVTQLIPPAAELFNKIKE